MNFSLLARVDAIYRALFLQMLLHVWLAVLVSCLSCNAFDFEGDSIGFDIYGSQNASRKDDLAAHVSSLSDASLLWGAYRSSLYFGVRPRIPRSLLSGLMWFNADSVDGFQRLRHFYEQGDNMKKANWIYYDPRLGGRQVIDDTDLHVKLVIDFVKSDDGKSWAVRVRSKPHKGFRNQKIVFLWYTGMEGENAGAPGGSRSSYIKLENAKDKTGYEDDVKIVGISEELGAFEMVVTDGKAPNRHPDAKKLLSPETDPRRAHHVSLIVPDDNVWRAGDIFKTLIQESVQNLMETRKDITNYPPEQILAMRDLHEYEGNFHIIQKVYTGPAEFSILFNNLETLPSDSFSVAHLEQRIQETHTKFKDKFSTHFPITAASKFDNAFGSEVLSGLLGGLSYFYGDHLVDRDTVLNEETFDKLSLVGKPEGPHELFTLVPSRPFFPRGFLWDEGFHLLPLLDYDSDLCFEIVRSWFDLIDENGWIAREQILGPEARSRVPEEFQVQSPEIVNPPTLMLVLTHLLGKVANRTDSEATGPHVVGDYSQSITKENLGLLILDNSELLIEYTKLIYPKLKTHYEWFRRTQQGLVEEFDRGENQEMYRWRGRTVSHSLASGIDDYPRALPVDIAELNVDLLSWIGVMTQSMKLIAEIAGQDEDLEKYIQIEENIVSNLDSIHWSQSENTYCDVSVDEDDENVHVCHKGYVSLFPFLTKLIPITSEEKIMAMVNLLSDPAQLRSDYGIRSLSSQDEYYRHGENYWKSPVWININYLALESLQYYFEHAHLNQLNKRTVAVAYSELRADLINNVRSQWKETGYMWEQYDDITGRGKGAKNFLGWTLLVLLMMNMPETL